ncbi:MAG: PepSY domain-containing protein [Gammaproteobacteria bacterium]|jgi:uncharacterized membrane protein YkoI|nr:PepSY domain-containing protein [Gammaproteobacteria bacterium]
MKATGSILLAIALLGASALAQADRRTSLEDAVSEARGRYPGRVLSAETDRRGGRESYKIRILTRDGQVKRLRIDPESGRVQRRGRR